jgi:hypothetical protein
MGQGCGRLNQCQEARVADLHAPRRLVLGHHFREEAHMLGAHDLGQHQRRYARHDGCGDIRYGEGERAIDAHHDIGSALGNSRDSSGNGCPCGRLVCRQDGVLEIEDDGVGAARMRLCYETLGRYGYEEERAPVRLLTVCHVAGVPLTLARRVRR